MKNLIIVICIFVIIYLLYKIRNIDTFEQSDEDLYTKYLAKQLKYLDPRVEKVFEKLSFHDGQNRSYTLNKQSIHLCKVDENGELYEKNQLMLVLIHEIAHVLCTNIGHTDEFNEIFEDLLEKATKQGLYDPNIKPVDNYCQY